MNDGLSVQGESFILITLTYSMCIFEIQKIQCNLSYPGSLGPRGARKYESSTTCVDFETLHTLNILFSLISFKQ